MLTQARSYSSARNFHARHFGYFGEQVQTALAPAGGLVGRERRKSGYARFVGQPLVVGLAPLWAYGGAATPFSGAELRAYTDFSERPTAAGSFRLRTVPAIARTGEISACGGAEGRLDGVQAVGATGAQGRPTAAGVAYANHSRSFALGATGGMQPRGIRNPTDEELLVLLRKVRRRS